MSVQSQSEADLETKYYELIRTTSRLLLKGTKLQHKESTESSLFESFWSPTGAPSCYGEGFLQSLSTLRAISTIVMKDAAELTASIVEIERMLAAEEKISLKPEK